MLAFFFVTLLTCIAIWLRLKRPAHSLHLLVFLSPWFGLDVDFGLRLTAFQVFTFPLALIALISILSSSISQSRFPASIPLVLFVVWAALVTSVQIPFLPDSSVVGGWFREPMPRAIGQILMLALTVSPAFIIPNILRRPADVALLGQTYLWSISILALLGWFQLVVWYKSGTNPFPIGLLNGLLGGSAGLREGFYEYGLLSINRMSSFGGEPKNLAGALVVGLMLIQVLLTSPGKGINRQRLLWLWIFLAASSVATLSTTGFVLWAMGTLTHICWRLVMRHGQNGRAGFGRMMQFVIAIPLLISITGVVMHENGIPIVDIVLDRTVMRFEESKFGIFEDFDYAIRNYLFEHPLMAIIGVGMGSIHLYADPYLAPEVALYAGGGVFVAKAQYLRLISEVGLVGLFLFLLWSVRLLVRIKSRSINYPYFPTSHIMSVYWAISVLLFMAAGSGSAQFFLTAGVMMAFVNLFNSNGASSQLNVH